MVSSVNATRSHHFVLLLKLLSIALLGVSGHDGESTPRPCEPAEPGCCNEVLNWNGALGPVDNGSLIVQQAFHEIPNKAPELFKPTDASLNIRDKKNPGIMTRLNEVQWNDRYHSYVTKVQLPPGMSKATITACVYADIDRTKTQFQYQAMLTDGAGW